jgi:hypothetical protein
MINMVCRDLYNEQPFEKWKTDAYAEHTHQFLTRMLSMRTSALRVCSACAPVPVAYAQLTHNNFLSTSKMKNFKKSLLTLTNGLKSSTEKNIFWPKLRRKTSLKID